MLKFFNGMLQLPMGLVTADPHALLPLQREALWFFGGNFSIVDTRLPTICPAVSCSCTHREPG